MGEILIKFYSLNCSVLNQLHKNLKKSSKPYSFFRLPSKSKEIAIRPAVSGRGYASYKKYKTVLHKAICKISNLKDLNNFAKFFKVDGLFFEVKVN